MFTPAHICVHQRATCLDTGGPSTLWKGRASPSISFALAYASPSMPRWDWWAARGARSRYPHCFPPLLGDGVAYVQKENFFGVVVFAGNPASNLKARPGWSPNFKYRPLPPLAYFRQFCEQPEEIQGGSRISATFPERVHPKVLLGARTGAGLLRPLLLGDGRALPPPTRLPQRHPARPRSPPRPRPPAPRA